MLDSRAIHAAFVAGDVDAIRTALGEPAGFPNCEFPDRYADSILEYAIYHSPVDCIRALLELGADANYDSAGGFPSIIAALSSVRPEALEIVDLLLASGADIQQRGINDHTPLHYAAAANDVRAVELLLERGADVNARTRIDDYATPLEEAELLGKEEAAAVLRAFSGNA